MDLDQLRRCWQAEEDQAHIHGWDFSHIDGRYGEEEDLPWDYGAVVRQALTHQDRILDIDTGGGEFLLSLGHPAEKTSATEGYPPNVSLCREKLLPMGIDFREAADCASLPFQNGSFDRVLDRHGDFCPAEIARVLKPGGLFLTQQVGEENDRELVELLLPGTPKPFSGLNLTTQRRAFEDAGFEILRGEECFRPIVFYDVGALVWFARIIEWEFPGFSVDACFDRLLEAQRILETRGRITGRIHRYLIVARKK